MSKKLLILTLVLSILLIGCQQPDECKWDSFKPERSHFWTCVEGCYEMQLIYEEEFNISIDEVQQRIGYNPVCWGVCWKSIVKKNITKNANNITNN